MVQKIARKLFEIQCANGFLKEKDCELYEYAYRLLLRKLTLYFCISIIGMYMGTFKEILIFLFAFVLLRQYAGGFHFEKSGRCFFITLFIIYLVGEYLINFPVPTEKLYILWIISIINIFIFAPLECRNKKLDLDEQRNYKKNKRSDLSRSFNNDARVLFYIV